MPLKISRQVKALAIQKNTHTRTQTELQNWERGKIERDKCTYLFSIEAAKERNVRIVRIIENLLSVSSY